MTPTFPRAINGSFCVTTPRRPLKVAIIGHGAIAQYVRGHLARYGITEIAQIVRPGKEARGDGMVLPRVSHMRDLPQIPNLVIECGGHAALAAHGPEALSQGIDVLTVSLGALANADLCASLEAAAKAGSARLHLTNGAIGGLDALRSARFGDLTAVQYTGRKPPKGWRG